MNFKKETINAINRVGKAISHVVFPINRTETINISSNIFTLVILDAIGDFEYDNGYGSQVINSKIRIVFEDGSYLKRSEYDGSEWWEYVEPAPTNVQIIEKISEFKKYTHSLKILEE